MRKRVFVLAAILASAAWINLAHAAPAAPPEDREAKEQKLVAKFYEATALLYAQQDDGALKMVCTATAFERKGDVFRFVTAAHCVAEDDEAHDRVQVESSNWYITFDDPVKKDFYSAKILGVGYQHRGDDFAVLEVKLNREVPSMSLAANPATLGEQVINIASPLGLGKQLFRGHVSMPKLNRPVAVRDINWKGAQLLQISVGGGSSGSSVVSVKQEGIISFLVGSITYGSSPFVVAIPVAKFKDFWEKVQAGKYKWYKPELTDDEYTVSKKRGRFGPKINSRTLEYRPTPGERTWLLPNYVLRRLGQR